MSQFSNFLPNVDEQIQAYLKEDGIDRLLYVLSKHPTTNVDTTLHWKSNVVVSGMPLVVRMLNNYFKNDLGNFQFLIELEGKKLFAGHKTNISLPFNVFIVLERTVLNLLHHMCAISTTTANYVQKASLKNISILDTRKTIPGLRNLERYAVSVGGGQSHRQDYADCLMIKDNQKSFFGGLKDAWSFYQQIRGFYQPIIVEVHNLKEFETAMELGVKHVMLDNFSREMILKAVQIKPLGVSIELSGGVNLQNIEQYLIDGVDAISLSSITFWPERIDISWKVN